MGYTKRKKRNNKQRRDRYGEQNLAGGIKSRPISKEFKPIGIFKKQKSFLRRWKTRKLARDNWPKAMGVVKGDKELVKCRGEQNWQHGIAHLDSLVMLVELSLCLLW